jgi:signal transduction histidine kinase
VRGAFGLVTPAASLALAAGALLLAPAPALASLLLALGLSSLGRRRLRRRDRWLVWIAGGIAAAALAAAAIGSWRRPLATARFQSLATSSYSEFWSTLEASAGHAAERLRNLAGGPGELDPVAAFGALAEVARASNASPSEGYLLFDPEGGARAWGGAGLLHEPAPADLTRSRAVNASFTAATFYVVRAVREEARPWRIVVGRSVATPELPFRLPGDVAAASWTMAPTRARAERLVELHLGDGPALWIERSAASPAWIERARRVAALVWGVALVGLATGRVVGWRTLAPTILRRRARPIEASILASGAVAALSVASGCPAAVALAAALATGGLGTAILQAAAPAIAALPMAGATAAAIIAWRGAAGAEASPLAAAWLTFSLAATATALVALVRVRSSPRSPLGLLAVTFLVSATIAAAAGQTAHSGGDRGARAGEPLGAATLERLSAATERALAAADLETLGPGTPELLDVEDLAFALWSRSPLARPDVHSAMIVTLLDGQSSTFSLGLPLAANTLDRSPAVWADLVGTPPEVRLAEGSAALRAGASPWGDVVFWALPGASPTPAPTPPEQARLRLLRRSGLAGSVPRARAPRTYGDAVERVGSRALSAAGIAAALLGLGAVFALARPTVRHAARRALRSYSKRLLLLLTVLALVPVLVINLVLMQAFAARLEREQRAAGEQALQAAQRVLGEYVDTLAPGFGLDTVLDDDLLRWLARVVRRDVNLYWGSRLYATSQPELFSTALLPRRIPAEIHRDLALAGAELAVRVHRAAGVEYLELYAPFRRPSERAIPRSGGDVLTLSLPLVAQQEDLERETAALRRRAVLGTVALLLLFVAVGGRAARNFTRPLQELVAGTQRIAAGAASLGLAPSEAELQALVEAVDRMAAQIAAGREQLRRAERLEAWAEMARLIAHEIKNPLTPIRLSAEHMREVYERQPERFGPVFARCVDNILRQVEELRAIAAEFSTYSGIPRIALETAELNSVLQEAVSAYDSGADGRVVRLEAVDPALRVRVDPRLFGRALRNVLENALRASAGQPVDVRARIEPGGREARVDVLDRGPGVAPDLLERIFEPYFSTHSGGTGLGLPIARRILEEHGGRLWAETREGGGLRVSMTLPAAAARAS